MSDMRDTVTTPHPLRPLQESAGTSKDELQPRPCAYGTAQSWDVDGSSQLTPVSPHRWVFSALSC